MGLSPYRKTLAEGVRASATTETYALSTRGRAGIIVILDTDTASGFSQTISVEGVDPVSGEVWTILAAAAQTAAGQKILRVRPGITAAANVAAADILPADINVKVTHTDATSITRTIAVQLTD